MAQKPLTPGVAKEIAADGVKVTSKVSITAPKQADGKAVSFTTESLATIASLTDPTNFKPGRLIANVRLSKESAIYPPVKLGIEITQADVQRSRGQKFKVGYHNGSQWVVLRDEITSAASTVEVELSKVGDPPIGLAP
jgi:hypothetical protein